MTLQKLRDYLLKVEGSLDRKEMLKAFVEGIEVIALGDLDYDDSSEMKVEINRVAIETFTFKKFPERGDLRELSEIEVEYDYFNLKIVCQAKVMECARISFTLDNGEVVELFVDDCEVFDDGECLCTVVVPVKEAQ